MNHIDTNTKGKAAKKLIDGEKLKKFNYTNVEKINNKEYKTIEKEAYEVICLCNSGVKSLERESKEEYIRDYLEKWLLKPLNFKVSSVIEEKDESYLLVFTKYFKLEEGLFIQNIKEKEELY